LLASQEDFILLSGSHPGEYQYLIFSLEIFMVSKTGVYVDVLSRNYELVSDIILIVDFVALLSIFLRFTCHIRLNRQA
jgi:hypothetical protein